MEFKNVLKNFIKEEIVEGRMFQNWQDLGVRLFYRSPNKVEIRGLGADLPPNLLFEGDEVFVCGLDEKWEEVKENIGFQIFRLLDPRLYQNLADRATETKPPEGIKTTFVISYQIGELELALPPIPVIQDFPALQAQEWKKERLQDLNNWMENVLNEKRQTWFHVNEAGRLVAMDLQELPPSNAWGTILFFYPEYR